MSGIKSFYNDKNAKTIEEKIKVLEQQLQEFPDYKMDRGKRLIALERKFTSVINYSPPQKKESNTKKWQEAFKQVDDKPVKGSIGGVQLNLKTENEVYNPYEKPGFNTGKE